MSGEPLYSIVASQAEALISSGEWQEGDRLPPERQLCRDFDVSRSTLRQALGELEERGLITRHQGRGTFVTRPRVQLPIAGVFSIRDALAARGVRLATRVVNVEIIDAGRQLASDLGCLPGDRVVHLERLRLADDEPMVLDSAHLRADLFPGLEDTDFEKRSLYATLTEDFGRTPAEAVETLEPVILTPHECQLLEVPRHTPALLTRRVTADARGEVIALGHVLLRGDRSRYLFRRTVDDLDPALAGTAAAISEGQRKPATTETLITTRRER
jgi:GntR family transcriptional regulator